MMVGAPLEILYEDDWFLAVNKPSGILVHRTGISEDKRFVLQLLRNQVGYRVYPIHRLDRGTSGVLLFGKLQEAAAFMGLQLRTREVRKQYLAIVRGFMDAQDTIDYPIADAPGEPKQEAVTHYRRLAQAEINTPVGRYATARYSLVEITPETGRFHQIRKHFSHLRHPVIGDKKHGDIKHNAYFREVLNIPRLLLHASQLAFPHPQTADIMLKIEAPLDSTFLAALEVLGLHWEEK